jgi:hypothetical protein
MKSSEEKWVKQVNYRRKLFGVNDRNCFRNLYLLVTRYYLILIALFDSDSVNRGSNPRLPARNTGLREEDLFCGLYWPLRGGQRGQDGPCLHWRVVIR